MSGLAAASGSADTANGWLVFAQKAFIVDGDRLLLVRKSPADPCNPGLWEVPGGRMEAGEDLDGHICREVWEETGVDIRPGRPFRIWQWTMPGAPAGRADMLHVIAVARMCEPNTNAVTGAHRRPDDYIDRVKWVPLAELSRYQIIPDLEPAMQDFLGSSRVAIPPRG